MPFLLRSLAIALIALAPATAVGQAAPRFEVTIAPAAHAGPLTGRLIVAVSKNDQVEPRFQVAMGGPAIFGVDLEGVRPGTTITVDGKAIGYPMSLAELPAGDYWVQAVVRVYSEVHRADGHTLWLPMNDGRIESFHSAAGNLISEVQKVRIDGGSRPIRIAVNRVLPALPRPADTEWVKRITVQSKKLTAFWGRPTYIHAAVLLPRGYAEEPNRRYPAIYTLGHGVPFQFRTDSVGQGIGHINPITGTETGFDFHKAWIRDDFPRVIVITLEQQTPFFPDSYSINSANNGPYGDAVVEEVIPELERQFRIIAEPYARHLEGASTSGWQTLALQLHYPDYFGGAWIFQPDPIDFARHQLIDIYRDENAFTIPVGQFLMAERPMRRTVEGQPIWSVRQMSRFEAVLGSKGRSGRQFQAWEAVYGPTDSEGYPKPLWDPLTGVIDKSVAAYWKEHGYDLRDYAERNWTTLGPKLAGKLRFFLPDMDDFYLNLAMYRFEDFLKRAESPKSDAEFIYGRPMKGHSWHPYPWAELVRRFAATVEHNAPRRR